MPRAKKESLRLDQSEKGIKWSLTSNLKRTETRLSVEIGAIAKAILYSRLLITPTFKGNRKSLELSGVRVIGNLKKIAASKVKNSFYCTVNI